MKKLKDLLGTAKFVERSQQLIEHSKPLLSRVSQKSQELYMTSSVFVADLSIALSNSDFVQSLNEYHSELSKSMDEGFKIGTIDPETYLAMTPNNHRILDGGHGFFESISKAQEIGQVEGWSNTETFTHWIQAYFTDMSSAAGMPIFDGATDNIYLMLRNMGFDEHTARDLVTINGQEAIEALVGGSLTAVSLFFAWKKQDKENFSRALGSIGLGAAVTINPAALVVLIIAAGVGYNTLVCKNAVQRGSVLSFVALGTSALIPGPLIIGIVPGIVLAMYANKKMGKDFVPLDLLKTTLSRAIDPVEREKMVMQVSSIMKSYNRKKVA